MHAKISACVRGDWRTSADTLERFRYNRCLQAIQTSGARYQDYACASAQNLVTARSVRRVPAWTVYRARV
jgi:predicted SprT family Zn-dependent metalloprotease